MGFVEGTVEIGEQEFVMRRQDASGNGLFDDKDDRVTIDLNHNLEWEVDEKFGFLPIMVIQGQRFSVVSDEPDCRLLLRPVSETGTLKLAPKLASPLADIMHLRVTFSGQDGSAFTVDGLDPIVVPTGDYEITYVAISVDDQHHAAKSFVFSSRGATSTPRAIHVEKDGLTEIDPIGQFRFEANGSRSVSPGKPLSIGLRLYTEDGLLISHSHTGVAPGSIRSNTESTVQTSFVNFKGVPIGGCKTGFY